jgi:hypothetical protein
MTREEKCKLAIERGYTYNSETGIIYSRLGKIVKHKQSKGYIIISLTVNKKNINLLGHHFAWYCFYGNCNTNQIDHINGVRTDNRICNLRAVTNQQNQWNRTAAKGYYWNKKINRWKSQIKINNKCIHLGLFNIEEEARNAYLAAKQKYHVI